MGKLSFGATGLSYQVEEVKLKVGGAPECPRCKQRVYFNEEKRAIGKVWHKRCFTCVNCKKNLDSTNCEGHDGDIYCTPCHKRAFGPKGYGFAAGAAGLSTDKSGKMRSVSPSNQQVAKEPKKTTAPVKVDPADPENCPRCGKRVYFAEEVKALKRKFHRLCFKCGSCNKMLEPGRCSEHDGDLYCTSCYGRKFGPKGYGYAGGAGTMLSSEAAVTSKSPSKAPSSRFYPAVKTSVTDKVPNGQGNPYVDEVITPAGQGNQGSHSTNNRNGTTAHGFSAPAGSRVYPAVQPQMTTEQRVTNTAINKHENFIENNSHSLDQDTKQALSSHEFQMVNQLRDLNIDEKPVAYSQDYNSPHQPDIHVNDYDQMPEGYSTIPAPETFQDGGYQNLQSGHNDAAYRSPSPGAYEPRYQYQADDSYGYKPTQINDFRDTLKGMEPTHSHSASSSIDYTTRQTNIHSPSSSIDYSPRAGSPRATYQPSTNDYQQDTSTYSLNAPVEYSAMGRHSPNTSAEYAYPQAPVTSYQSRSPSYSPSGTLERTIPSHSASSSLDYHDPHYPYQPMDYPPPPDPHYPYQPMDDPSPPAPPASTAMYKPESGQNGYQPTNILNIFGNRPDNGDYHNLHRDG